MFISICICCGPSASAFFRHTLARTDQMQLKSPSNMSEASKPPYDLRGQRSNRVSNPLSVTGDTMYDIVDDDDLGLTLQATCNDISHVVVEKEESAEDEATRLEISRTVVIQKASKEGKVDQSQLTVDLERG